MSTFQPMLNAQAAANQLQNVLGQQQGQLSTVISQLNTATSSANTDTGTINRLVPIVMPLPAMLQDVYSRLSEMDANLATALTQAIQTNALEFGSKFTPEMISTDGLLYVKMP